MTEASSGIGRERRYHLEVQTKKQYGMKMMLELEACS